MNIFSQLLDFILNIDTYIISLVQYFGIFSYVILGLIIFIETGLVVVPFIPGDSILFVVGLIASQHALNIFVIIIVLIAAAIVGDTCNYFIGHFLGHKILKNKKILKYIGKHIEKTKRFYEEHGSLAIVYARFVPIVRTIAPFIAGVTDMHYQKFAMYNIVGGILWVIIVTSLGYFLGNITFIKDNLTLILLIIVILSILPTIIALIKPKNKKKPNLLS